jgi:hypothetical protein
MNLKKIRKNEKGAVMVLIALLIVVLLGFTALAVDFGIKYANDSKAQQVCDAAALAAASALPDKDKALKIAQEYVEKNGLDWDKVRTDFPDDTQISLRYTNQIDTTFAKVLGINKLNSTKTSVAKAGDPNSKDSDFDYAIFSGNPDANLMLNGAKFDVTGKVHSNGTLNVQTAGTHATNYTSCKGGKMDTWNTFYYKKDNAGNYVENGNITDPEPERAPFVDMPYYLGDNIAGVIPDSISVPRNTYWDEEITAKDISTWGENGEDVKKAFNSDNSFHLIKKTAGGFDANYAINLNADLYLDTEEGGSLQLLNNNALKINGDVYITNEKQTRPTRLFFNEVSPWGAKEKSVINGNIYCLSGDLTLGNVIVNGNIYCAGQLKTDGGAETVFNSDYVYANSIYLCNSTKVAGAMVAEKDIKFEGGTHDVKSGNKLSIYSKRGDIQFGGKDSIINGIIFAPYGSITAVGSCEVYGRIIGDKVSLGNHNVSVYPQEGDMGVNPEQPTTQEGGGRKPVLVE